MEHVEVRAGAYADSVTLLQVSAQVQAVPGVRSALIAMATELNTGLLAGLGMSPPAGATPNDLIVAVSAADDESLGRALGTVDSLLADRSAAAGGGNGAEQAPRTTLSAIRRGGPAVCLVSVPGPHAFAEACDALDAGCDVMIFSDNVPVEQEIALKDRAGRHGLLVMGPDCGTAIIGGIGLGFSHSVAGGPIGLVAASGTGAQQMVSLLDAAGAGVGAVLGVGGRDLSARVRGRSARTALRRLDEDPDCELAVLVSKPPDEQVAAELREFAATLSTPVRFALIGAGQPDLTAAAAAALADIGRAAPRWPRWDPAGPPPAPPPPDEPGQERRGLRGLFSGGTLCDEAMVIAAERLGPVYSNIPLRPQWRADGEPAWRQNLMIDFGDDELTAGRPHPMIDPSLRLARLAAEAADPSVAVILLDVVLGYGAHQDPAAEFGPAIAAALAGRPAGHLAVVVSLIGTRSDPQSLPAQAQALAGAGAHVFGSNAQAARFACDVAAGRLAAGRDLAGRESAP